MLHSRIDTCVMAHHEWQALPRVQWEAISKDYSIDHWDGPMAGICTYQGVRYYFHCVELGHDVEECAPTVANEGREASMTPRLYIMFEPTLEQLAFDDHWHALFVEHVESKRGTVDRSYYREHFYDHYEKAAQPQYFKEQAKFLLEW